MGATKATAAMPGHRRPARGFTLIELMIVVAVIGVLAAIAVSNFLKFQAKAKQTEARANLGAIYVAQTGHFALNNAYGGFPDIGFYSLDAAARFYTYRDGIVANTQPGRNGAEVYAGAIAASFNALGFTATAAGTISTVGYTDSWYINDQRTLVNERQGY